MYIVPYVGIIGKVENIFGFFAATNNGTKSNLRYETSAKTTNPNGDQPEQLLSRDMQMNEVR